MHARIVVAALPFFLACSKPSPPPPPPPPPDASWQVAPWQVMTSADSGAPIAAKTGRVVATGLNSPSAVVATGGHVYIADGERLLRTPKSGGELETVATADAPIRALAVSDQDVVWLTSRGVYSIRSVNTKTFPVHTLRTGDTYHALTVIGADVLIAEGSGKHWAIRRVTGATTAIVAELTTQPVSIAANKTHVWIADIDGRVLRAARFTPGDVKTLIPPPATVEIWRLAASDESMFALGGDHFPPDMPHMTPPPWLDGGPSDPRLFRLEQPGQPAMVLWRGIAKDWVATKDRVVLLDLDEGTIVVVPLPVDEKGPPLPMLAKKSPATRLFAIAKRARALAIEPGWVYAASAGDGGATGELTAFQD